MAPLQEKKEEEAKKRKEEEDKEKEASKYKWPDADVKRLGELRELSRKDDGSHMHPSLNHELDTLESKRSLTRRLYLCLSLKRLLEAKLTNHKEGDPPGPPEEVALLV